MSPPAAVDPGVGEAVSIFDLHRHWTQSRRTLKNTDTISPQAPPYQDTTCISEMAEGKLNAERELDLLDTCCRVEHSGPNQASDDPAPQQMLRSNGCTWSNHSYVLFGLGLLAACADVTSCRFTFACLLHKAPLRPSRLFQ
jgi:hypothetical protein